MSNERLSIIKELFQINSAVEVLFYEKVLGKISTDDLVDFKIYILANKNIFENFETALVRLAKEFEARRLISALQQGKFRFRDKNEMIGFIKLNFKNKEIASGVGFYKDVVVIAMDRDGYLVNRYTLKQLNSEDESNFYEELFKQQQKIGVIKHISAKELLEFEAKKELGLKKLREEKERRLLQHERNKSFEYNKALDKFLKKMENKMLVVRVEG